MLRGKIENMKKGSRFNVLMAVLFDFYFSNTVKPQLKAPFWMTRNLKRGLKLGDSSTKLDDTKIFNFFWEKAESVGIKNC